MGKGQNTSKNGKKKPAKTMKEKKAAKREKKAAKREKKAAKENPGIDTAK